MAAKALVSDGAIHGPGVEVWNLQSSGEFASGGGFSGTRGSVDGDNHAANVNRSFTGATADGSESA